MKYKFSLSPQIKGYVEWQLEHYHEDKRQLEEYKNSLMPTVTAGYSFTAGCSSGASSPTENVGIKLATDAYILMTERNIRAVERVLDKLDETDRKIINLVYWKQSHTVEGAGLVIGLSRRGTYKRINNMLCLIALETGLVTF